MNIDFVNEVLPKQGVLVVLVGEGKSPQLPPSLAGAIDKELLNKAYKGQRFSGKARAVLDIVAPSGIDVDRLLIVGIGGDAGGDDKDSSPQSVFEDIGGSLVQRLASSAPELVSIFLPQGLKDKEASAAALGFGALLGAYRFDKYRTKLKEEDKRQVNKIAIALDKPAEAKKLFKEQSALAEGINFARDLAMEPANILYPAEFAKRVKALEKAGLKVEVLKEAQLKKLGMGALLGVGQGSVRESHVVVMKWQGAGAGAGAKQAPIALVGKGVCFDTGGISLKPAGGMEDMKADMGGAACVTGTMLALAKRKAKTNAVGIIGLVENMPDGNAQRPGDIVKSMSGQTIEVLNTDAEGRLVLADILWFAQEKFKPQAVVNFATLTGAIIVALGKEHAGLFSNNDRLAERLSHAGQEAREKVWRLPLTDNYNKMMNSKTADMRNIGGGREAGSITAAQFLQRFIKKGQAWAHVDIAGTAMGTKLSPTSPAWASGFGVRLVHRLIQRHYEK